MPHDVVAGATCAWSMLNVCESLDFLSRQDQQSLQMAEQGVAGTISGEAKAFLEAGISTIEQNLMDAREACGIDIPESLIRKFAGSSFRDIPRLALELRFEVRKVILPQLVKR